MEVDTNNGGGGGLGKRKANMHDATRHLSARKRKEMRIRLSLTRPSYVLNLCPKPYRPEHRRRLQYLLRRLVNQQDWVGASGVISVYMKGTLDDSSILKNRFKFWALLELLKHVGNHFMNSNTIRSLYDIWSKKIGSLKIRSTKTSTFESRYAVLLENMLFYLMQGNAEEASPLATCIEQEKVDIDPVSKIILGLTSYEKWYSSIPEEFQWRDLDQIDGQENSHMEGTSFSNEVRQSEWHNTVESHTADSQFQCYSDSSVMNNRQMSKDVGLNNDMTVPMVVKANHKREKQRQIFQPQDFYSSDENQGTGDPFSNSGGFTQDILNALGRLDLWLLPVRFENVNGLLEFMIMHRNQFNVEYNKAVEYLLQALTSTSFASAALLPLIQLKLIGGQVNEALTLLEQQCDNSYSVLPIRLRVVLLEHFDRNNYLLIQSCYEDILKKDPTCRDSLAKLITTHQEGDYSLESLLEMIALHLDATDAEYNTWKVLAICFSKLSLHEEDILSTCSNQKDKVQGLQHSSSRETPKIFTEGLSAKSWNLRCRWWLTKYFSNSKFEANIKTGDLQLLTYKAACALYMYGQEFSYVVKAYSHLQKENDKDLLLFLAEHKRNSYGIYNTNSKKANCLR